MSRKEALSQFINQIHGRPVVVKLNSGVDYRGMLKISISYETFLHLIRYANHIHFWHKSLTSESLINVNQPLFLIVISLIDYRCFGLFGWLHEYRIRSNRRICKRSIEKQIRRCIHPRKQCFIHIDAEATSVNRSSIELNKIKSSHAHHQFWNSIINQQMK